MYSTIYLSLSVIVIFWSSFLIYRTGVKERQKRNSELIRLNSKFSININILFSWIFLTLGILIIYFLYDAVSKSNVLFRDKYIEDFFQIFDEDYINSLRKYFVDNAMVAHLLVTVQYFIKIPRFVFLTVLMLSYSIYYCYIGFKPNIIYEDGILINNTLYKWDNIKGFEWGELRERENKAYYDLTVNLPKLYDLNADKKLRINADDRDKISQILNDNIEKSGV